MAKRTTNIGLKTPEGPDPFLTADFVENYQIIDAEFAKRPVSTTTDSGSTTTHGHTEYATTTHGHTEYAPASHTHSGSGGLLVGGSTAQFTTNTSGFATVSHGLTFTPTYLTANVTAPTGGQANLPVAVVIDKNSITATSVTVRIYYVDTTNSTIQFASVSATIMFMGVQ